MVLYGDSQSTHLSLGIRRTGQFCITLWRWTRSVTYEREIRELWKKCRACLSKHKDQGHWDENCTPCWNQWVQEYGKCLHINHTGQPVQTDRNIHRCLKCKLDIVGKKTYVWWIHFIKRVKFEFVTDRWTQVEHAPPRRRLHLRSEG